MQTGATLPIFSRKTKAKSSDALLLTQDDEILGYLDEVFRKRVSLSLVLKGKRISTDILFMDTKNKAMRIQMGAFKAGQNGEDVTVGFSLDRTWWSFKSKVVFMQDKPYLLVPKTIKHAERRKTPRTAFTAREQVKVTIMEGIGSGNGVFGLATDVSPDGLCLIIEKAMILSSQCLLK